MKKTVLLPALLLTALLAASCEKMLMVDDLPPTAANTFDYLWQQFDRQYSQFDVKKVDWGEVYDTLRPRVRDGMPPDSLFALCAAMLNTLNDGHVNLYTSFDVSRADSLYHDFYTRSGIDINTVVLNYLGTGYHITGALAHSPLCGGRVIYVRYGSFGSSVSAAQLRTVIGTYPDAEGLILDLRGNGGGALLNVSNILSVMPSHGQKLYSSQIKSGPGHNDFSQLADTYAPQVPPSDAYHRPVVVLVDRGSFSATSVFAICTQAYENMLLMGDTTGGGLGLPSQGILPNGWIYRLPVTRTFALDGRNYENGVPPDIPLRFDLRAAQTLGRDNIIDSACSLILQAAFAHK